jgi:hypothetical protein
MFHTYVASVLFECFVCLQWFSNVLGVFSSVSEVCFKCFIYLWNMLQVLHLDVSKAD